VNEQFRQRLSRIFAEFGLNYADYCRFLPHMSLAAFAGTAALADVFLDSIGWSGCNSTLESIAQNIPVVTLPETLMRGRHSLAILKMMGVEETIATSKEDYIELAVRLGQDPQYRQEISQRIAENKHKLYADLTPVVALEDWFVKIVQKPLNTQDISRRLSLATVSEALQLAVEYHRSDRLAEAEQVYRQILSSQRDHPGALYGFSLLAKQRGDYEEAEHLLRSLLNIQPNSVKALVSLGNLYQVQGQLPEAVAFYQQALSQEPNSVAIYNNLGYTLQQQGKLEDAIACYQRALELQPDCLEAQINLANSLHQQGKLSPAQQTYYADLNLKLGIAQEQQGNLETAVSCYQQAIALQPDLAEAQEHLGRVLEKQGKLDQALYAYQQALQVNPQLGNVYFSLGKLYQTQNNLQSAASAYQQGLRLINPHYAKVLETQARLNTTETKQSLSPIPQEAVIIGEQAFPAIPAVSITEEKRPFWSVVIPVYNRTSYLLECLASVLAQWTGKDAMEILVIDDASHPPLADLVNSLGQGIVRYYRNTQNLGQARTWNTGVSLSRGYWIHLLHDDDYVLPGFYARLQQSLEAFSESIGAAFTGYENIDEQGEVTFSQQGYGEDPGIVQGWLERISIGNFLNPPAVVIRRAVYERLGGYHPELIYTLDWELYKRIATFYDGWYEPAILARYRQHSQNMTTKLVSSGSQMRCIRRGIEISESYLPAERCAKITAASRSHHFKQCLENAFFLLDMGNVSGAFQLLLEAIKIDHSSQAIEQMFIWLTQISMTSLREKMISIILTSVE
jgi:tetratricopeptide (TPR) repeat protein